MNDVCWRQLDDDGLDLIAKNPNNMAIIETDITLRIDRVCYIENGRLRTANENVKRFAFLE